MGDNETQLDDEQQDELLNELQQRADGDETGAQPTEDGDVGDVDEFIEDVEKQADEQAEQAVEDTEDELSEKFEELEAEQ